MDLYYMPERTPCRTVIMAAKHMNIDLNLVYLDVRADHHLKPNFVAINPQHTIPTLVDNGFAVWESRAIIQYMASKVNSELYPIDPKRRAIVDRLLYFDLSTLYQSIMDYFFPQMYGKPEAADPEKHSAFKQAVSYLDGFLSGQTYVAGDRLTIADFSILSSLTFAQIRFDYDFSEWDNVWRWLNTLKTELPYYEEVNEIPLQQYKEKSN